VTTPVAPTGDVTSSDETTEQTAAPSADSGENPSPTDGDHPDDALPEWARKRLTRANAEAANYRTRLREAETRLEGAKTAEEYEQAVTDIKTRNGELEQQLARERVARKYHLPDDLAGRLQGKTVEELEADAKALQKYAAPAEPVVLSGGLDPADGTDGFDPVKEARRARAARR
jgi:hypothetical protein